MTEKTLNTEKTLRTLKSLRTLKLLKEYMKYYDITYFIGGSDKAFCVDVLCNNCKARIFCDTLNGTTLTLTDKEKKVFKKKYPEYCI